MNQELFCWHFLWNNIWENSETTGKIFHNWFADTLHLHKNMLLWNLFNKFIKWWFTWLRTKITFQGWSCGTKKFSHIHVGRLKVTVLISLMLNQGKMKTKWMLKMRTRHKKTPLLLQTTTRSYLKRKYKRVNKILINNLKNTFKNFWSLLLEIWINFIQDQMTQFLSTLLGVFWKSMKKQWISLIIIIMKKIKWIMTKTTGVRFWLKVLEDKSKLLAPLGRRKVNSFLS